MTTEITTRPTPETALQVFSAAAGLDPYLAKIKEELDAFVPDVTTKKGRDAIASIAHKVARSKTALDNIGKELVAELKDVPKKIDAERKRMRDTLDAWKDDVRRPLTEWEEAEEARVTKHKAGLELLQHSAVTHDFTAHTLRTTLASLQAQVIDSRWEEFESEAHRAKAVAVESLQTAIAEREKQEAELARLRAEAAAREQVERVPYIDEHSEAWLACAAELEKASPGFMTLGNMNGIECAVAAIRDLAARAESAPAAPAITLLAGDHSGMKVDYRGLFKQVQRAIKRSDPGYAEMLRQLEDHLQELGQRWYAGDTNVVDEILQLYCIERDARKTVGAAATAAPQAQDVGRGEVLVTVSGFTGSGKSAIAGEIEILCRALGLQVDWPGGDSEKNMTHADWIAALEQYKPRVRIVECNVPHSVVKGQDK